jgi:hypothetical protein
MHKLRIIISGKPKLMINSQDVYFGITRQCAQVELKNINKISKKKSFMQILQKWKNIFIKRCTT